MYQMFDKNSDLSTIYLGRTDMTRSDKIKAEERFHISEQGHTVENCWMVQNVKHFQTHEQINHSCPKHII